MTSRSEQLDEAARTVELLRRLRHRYTNYFQATYGWLQLGETDRALQYLAGCRKKLEGESRLMRHAPSPLVLALIEVDLELEACGVSLVYHVGPLESPEVQFPAEFSHPRFAHFLRDIVLRFVERVSIPGEELQAELAVRQLPESPAGAWVLSFSGHAGDDVCECWWHGDGTSQLLAAFHQAGYRVPAVEVGPGGWRLSFTVGGRQAGVC